MNKCKHKDKSYSGVSYSNAGGTFSPWICRSCGFEGEDVSNNLSFSDYEQVRLKYKKGYNRG